MTGWLRLHAMAIAEAARRLVRRPLGTLVALLMIGTTLALPLAGFVGLDNARALASHLPGQPQLSVFLANDATKADVERIGERLRRDPAAASVVFVAKDEAFASLKKSLALGEATSALRANPLPDAFVVTLRDHAPAPAEQLAEALRAEPKVGHVLLDSAWLRRVDALLAAASTLLGFVATLLAVAVGAVAFGAIRGEVHDGRAQIEVARLVGATEGTIRRPFVYAGAMLGALGSAVALALLALGASAVGPPLRDLAASYGSEYSLTLLAPNALGGVLVAAALLGALGGALAVGLAGRSSAS